MSRKVHSVEGKTFTRIDDRKKAAFTFSWRETGILQRDKRIPGKAISVTLKVSRATVELNFDDFDKGNQSELDLCTRTVDEVQNIVWSYFLNARKSTLYFDIGSGEERHSESPEEASSSRRSILKRIFSGNTTNIFLGFLIFSYVLLILVGIYAIFLIIVFQLVYLYYADRLMLNLGNIRPTAERPLVAIVSVKSKQETIVFLRTIGRRILAEIREQVSTLVLPSVGSSVYETTNRIDLKSSVQLILSRNGIDTSANDIEVKTKNVYSLVEKVSSKFNRPVPKIVITNSVISNASATGISARHSSIMITSGSLEELTDDELESVVGHELGHVKGHDPLILFGLTMLMYIGVFYLWYPLSLLIGLLYYILAFALIFAVGKILETRADTESAVVLQNASGLASSLTKMGFKQLFQEKYNPAAKLFDWFRFDPHPPIYFRVARMSKLAGMESTIRHTFLASLRDCILGFVSAIF